MPLAGLGLAALIAIKQEGNEDSFYQIADRLRLRRPTLLGVLGAIAVPIVVGILLLVPTRTSPSSYDWSKLLGNIMGI